MVIMEENKPNPELVAAIAQLLRQTLSFPLTAAELAHEHGYGRNLGPYIVEKLRPKIVCEWGKGGRGRRYQLRLADLPVGYVRRVWPELAALFCTFSPEPACSPILDVQPKSTSAIKHAA